MHVSVGPKGVGFDFPWSGTVTFRNSAVSGCSYRSWKWLPVRWTGVHIDEYSSHFSAGERRR